MTTVSMTSSRILGGEAQLKNLASLPDKVICGYFMSLPALWLCGLMLPAALTIICVTWLVYIRSRRALALAMPWFAVGIAQYLSVLINWSVTGESAGVLLKHLLASYVSGWFLLGSAIGIGASGIVGRTRLLRSIAHVSYYSIALAVPAYLLAFHGGHGSLFFVSPLGHLLPSSFASRNFAFGVFVYNWEDFGGALFPRLSLLSPWPTAMGAAGICMAFIAMNLRKTWERRWCIAGAVLMVVASMGRLAFLTLLACLLVRWFLDWKRPYQICALYLLLLGFVTLLIVIPEPGVVGQAVVRRFQDARPGASEVRNEVYEASWKGFYESPLFGHGWPGKPLATERVYATDGGMDVGTHSTVSGLLYKGGAITFCVFSFAFVSTAGRLLRQTDSALRKNTLMIFIALGVTCLGEGLESLVLPMLFVFFWIGAAITAPSGHELSRVEH